MKRWGFSSRLLKPLISICTILSHIDQKPNSYVNQLISKRPFLKCTLPGINEPIPFLYDTGAACSLVNRQVFRRFPTSQRPRKIPISIKARSASGNALKIDGCYLFKIQVLGKSVVHPIFVCQNLKSNILGQDFIKYHGLSFNAQTNQPYFAEPEETVKATLSKSVFLPPRSATMAEVNVNSLGQQILSINVPGCPQIYRNEVLIEACTVKKHNVYLANVSMVPQTLPKGTPIGDLEPINDSDMCL